MKEGRGLLVDIHNRELTRRTKRYEQRVSTYRWINGIRLVVADARGRIERQRADRAHPLSSQVREDYLVAMR